MPQKKDKKELLAELENLRQQVAQAEANHHKVQEMLVLRENEIQALLDTKPKPTIARFDLHLRYTYLNTSVLSTTSSSAEAY